MSATRTASNVSPAAKAKGFTLIEILIAIVVLAILTAIAVPNYNEFVRRARIVEATSGMNDMRTRMEQFFQDNRRYDSGAACGVAGPSASHFTITCASVGAPALAYNVVAQGTGSMSAFRYTMGIAPTGVTRATAAAPAGWSLSSTCWVVRKNGACS
ncbi:MAG TPA: type IV pilin protein [Casimicrobiaceae bacterium]|nr:type IV pilin protein [Casimicrobiaceae bacterium]